MLNAFNIDVGGTALGVPTNAVDVNANLAASSHEATVPPPPEGEWFQLYRGGGDACLRVRFDRLALFVEGGAGVAMISSNVLGKVMITDPGERFSIAFQAACLSWRNTTSSSLLPSSSAT